jgi:hypothetical protein
MNMAFNHVANNHLITVPSTSVNEDRDQVNWITLHLAKHVKSPLVFAQHRSQCHTIKKQEGALDWRQLFYSQPHR